MNKLSRYRKLRYKSVFESENQSSRLNVIGNPLERLSSLVDFEIFRPTLEASLFTGERKGNAGRPPIDCVLMFKILFLQRYYGLSDHQIEYQIVDRTSFRAFLGIENVDDVPDEKTIWSIAKPSRPSVRMTSCLKTSVRSWRPRAFSSTRGGS